LPLAYVAAITKTIKLATGILILPQRHPIYTAKEVATLDVLSGGRAILGIGSGWMKEEFEALGIDFHRRGAMTDEAILAMRALWSEGTSSFEGKHFKFGPPALLSKACEEQCPNSRRWPFARCCKASRTLRGRIFSNGSESGKVEAAF